MAIPNPRDRFWTTDPPATFEDEENGVVLICIFSSRGILRKFYAEQEIPVPARKDIIQRRFQKLSGYCKQLGWQGVAIDPDPETGESHIIRFDGVAGLGTNEQGEEEVDLAQAEAPQLETKKPATPKIITDLW